MGKVVKMQCVGYRDGMMECCDSGGFVSAMPKVDFKDEKIIGKTVLVEAEKMTISRGVGIYNLTSPRYVGLAENNEPPHYALEIKNIL